LFALLWLLRPRSVRQAILLLFVLIVLAGVLAELYNRSGP
jgi:hypothetical protein